MDFFNLRRPEVTIDQLPPHGFSRKIHGPNRFRYSARIHHHLQG